MKRSGTVFVFAAFGLSALFELAALVLNKQAKQVLFTGGNTDGLTVAANIFGMLGYGAGLTVLAGLVLLIIGARRSLFLTGIFTVLWGLIYMIVLIILSYAEIDNITTNTILHLVEHMIGTLYKMLFILFLSLQLKHSDKIGKIAVPLAMFALMAEIAVHICGVIILTVTPIVRLRQSNPGLARSMTVYYQEYGMYASIVTAILLAVVFAAPALKIIRRS